MHRSAALFTEIEAFSVFMTLVVYGHRNCTAEAGVDFCRSRRRQMPCGLSGGGGGGGGHTRSLLGTANEVKSVLPNVTVGVGPAKIMYLGRICRSRSALSAEEGYVSDRHEQGVAHSRAVNRESLSEVPNQTKNKRAMALFTSMLQW